MLGFFGPVISTGKFKKKLKDLKSDVRVERALGVKFFVLSRKFPLSQVIYVIS